MEAAIVHMVCEGNSPSGPVDNWHGQSVGSRGLCDILRAPAHKDIPRCAHRDHMDPLSGGSAPTTCACNRIDCSTFVR